mmetsp:Transcript_96816/g.271011  ORF Transcript_96816/g.271011 Transcript_96816/m.271011 type:complete len:207 (+) Transcript_96816:721-1341(+)
MCSSTGNPPSLMMHSDAQLPPKQPASPASPRPPAPPKAPSVTHANIAPATSSRGTCSAGDRSASDAATRCQKRGDEDMAAARWTSSKSARKRTPATAPSAVPPEALGASPSTRRRISSRRVSISDCTPSLGRAPARQATSPKARQKRRKWTRPPAGRRSRMKVASAPSWGASKSSRTSSIFCRGEHSSTWAKMPGKDAATRPTSAL